MLSQWACEGARATARGVAARRVLLNVGKGPLPRRKRKEATGWRRIARGRAAVKVVGFAPLAEAAGLLLPMRAPPRVFGPWLQRFPQHRCGVSAASPLGSVRMMLEHHTRAPAARSSTGARSRAPPVGPRATTAAARTVADASREKARTSFSPSQRSHPLALGRDRRKLRRRACRARDFLSHCYSVCYLHACRLCLLWVAWHNVRHRPVRYYILRLTKDTHC